MGSYGLSDKLGCSCSFFYFNVGEQELVG